ncbi:MAG: hypothetical protein KGN00_01265 [Chloroflexota bacterium]|nr:hypothetical protein [Chloroflexota bacterium]MDE3192291.1 hypothetical protein [Chloroflexota bacterium]
MSETPSWLDGLVGNVRCAACGRLYARSDLRPVGQRDQHWFVRCTCSACGSQGIAVVMVQAAVVPAPAAPTRPAITVDDVLSAHELLRDYSGNVDGLFGAGSSRTR